jgi:TPR repeat protein
LFDDVDPPEVEAAIYWSEKAAAAGEGCAAWNLAMHYRDQGEVAQHERWMQRACELGDDDAWDLLNTRE